MKWLTDASIRHPRLTLLLVLLSTVAMALGIHRLEVDPDVLRDLPDDLPAKALYDRVGDMFPSKEMLFIGVRAGDLRSPEALRQIQQLTRALERLPVVQQVLSPTNATVVVGTAQGMEIRDAADPFPTTPSEAGAFWDFLQEQENLSGMVVSQDGSVAAILVFLQARLQGTESEAAGEVLQVVEREGGDLELFPAGRPVVTYYSSKTIGKETGMLTSAALVLMIVLLGLLFFNLRGVFLPVGVVVGAVLWTMGGMGWVDLAMTHSTEALPILLIAIGVADGVHIVQAFVSRARATGRKLESVRATMDDLRRPVIMTSVTSAVGFLALNTSGVRSIMILGMLTSFGIMVALLFSLSFVPATLCLLPLPRSARKAGQGSARASLGRLQRLMVAWGDLLLKHRLAASLLLLALVALSITGATRTQVETSILANFPDDDPISISSAFIDQHFSGVTNLQVVFEAHEPDALKDPAFLQGIQDFETFARGLDGVGGTSSVLPMLRAMNRVLHQGDPAWDRLPGEQETEQGFDYELDENGNELALPVERQVSGRQVLSGYFSLLEMSGKPGDLANFVTDDYSSAKVTLFLTSDRKKVLDRVVSQVRDYLANHDTGASVEITGMAALMLAVNDLITQGQALSILVSLSLVFLVTALMFRSAVLGLCNVVPLFVALFFNFGVMGLAGLDINLMTMGVSSMAIGVGVDFAIHFVHRYRVAFAQAGNPRDALRNTMAESGVAIIMNMVAVAGGFLTLLLATFKGVVTMGLLISLIMAFSAIGALTILPLVFVGLRPRAIEGGTGRGPGAPGRALLLLLALPLLAPSPAMAQEADGRAVMEAIENRSSFHDMVGRLTLTLTSSNGGTKERVLKMASQENHEGETDMILYMESPADMRGNAFLLLGHADRDDERYVYIPALHRSNKIVGSGRKGAFMSSDFTYDDIGMPDLDEWTWTITGEQELDGHPCQVIEARAASDKVIRETGYTRVTWYIDRDLQTSRGADYYDKQDILTKKLRVNQVREISGVPFATDMSMVDLGTGHSSRMVMSELRVNQGVEGTWFTNRALQNGF